MTAADPAGRALSGDRVTVCARIERIEGATLQVRPARSRGACPGCEKGCARAKLFDWWGVGDRLLALPVTLVPAAQRDALGQGVRLRLALPERALVLASALVYLGPLLGLLAGTLAAAAVAGAEAPVTVPAGLAGLVLGWVVGRRLTRRWIPPLVVELDDELPSGGPGRVS